MNYMNYDFNKYLNKVNLSKVGSIKDTIGKTIIKTNIIEKKPKISIDSRHNKMQHRYSANNIKINKRTNKKYSITSEGNEGLGDTNKKKGHKQNNSFNFINPLSTSNENVSILQKPKKIDVRSNSSRMSSHDKNYIKRRRELNYRYDLTETEGRISSNYLKNRNSKLSNLSLFSEGLDFLGISSTINNNTNTFLQNIKTSDINNHVSNISKENKLSGRYYLNVQNVGKCPQIFNNYYSINGVSSSNFPIKVINVFNNK